VDIFEQVTKNTVISLYLERQRLADSLNIAKGPGIIINFDDPVKYCLEYLKSTLNNIEKKHISF